MQKPAATYFSQMKKNLRKTADTHNVKYHGLLYVFDLFLKTGLLDLNSVKDAINKLLQINKRLPADLFNRRIKEWENGRL